MTSSSVTESAGALNAPVHLTAREAREPDRVAWVMFAITLLVCAAFIAGIIVYIF